MPLRKRVDQLPAATGVTGTDYLILSRPTGAGSGTKAVTLTQLLTYVATSAGATGPTGASITGPAGEPGATGPAGESIVGPTGPQGVAGATGPQGTSGVVSVSAPLTNSGTSTAANLGVSVGTTAGTVCAGDDARLSNARTPTGAAGGDLTGSYPNPSIAAGAVTLAKTTGIQKIITSGTAAPTGGSDGDIYLRYQ